MIKNSISEILLPQLGRLVSHMNELANSNNVTMIARTHGQPASPTTFGKEIKVFSTRVQNQIDSLLKIPNNGKFGGASGNLNAHYISHPDIKWDEFAEDFVKSLGLID